MDVNVWQVPQIGQSTLENRTKLSKSTPKPAVENNEQLEKIKQQYYQEGLKAGEEKVRKELEQQKNALKAIVEKISNFDLSRQNEIEVQIAQLAKVLIKKIIKKEVLQSQEYIVSWIHQGIEELKQGQSEIKIKVNQSLIDIVNKELAELSKSKDNLICVETDDNLSIDEFIIESASAKGGFSLENALNEICDKLDSFNTAQDD